MGIPIPDLSGLAQQQGQLNQGAANSQTLANRPDQSNAWGNTNWTRNPDGSWAQANQMSGAGQGIFNTASGGQQNLAGMLGGGINYGSVPGLMGAAGTSQQAIDANMALQRPMLDQARDKENSRLGAMGITMGSQAYNSTQRNLGNQESDASQKAILAGNQEYGNIFNRALQGRQQGVNEVDSQYKGNLQGLQSMSSLQDSLDPSKHNSAVPGATGFTPTNVYNAGLDSYNAQLAQQNADRAESANRTAGYASMAGNLLGNSSVMGALGSAAGGAWNWLTSGNSGVQTNPSWYNNNVGTDYMNGSGMDALGFPNAS